MTTNTIRSVIRYAGAGKPVLIAEIELTLEELQAIQTKLVLGLDVIETYSTQVYWFNPGNPPKPVLLDNPLYIRGTTVQEDIANSVNSKVNTKWLFELKRADEIFQLRE